ncbi:DNA-3-methyladenine glycosylase [Conyzicola nivalis]|uniref:Putative 3-methyladenine DNA glycosylase n=1 Tax=Conyzicola nivalis TaxID=1477021 RepID=A0A916SVN0_9MICO|nr:DNA-3-methyladenine glycosylase [Conyzicola nivalis]GGB15679.1 putative 3-methyladenine DNA glycosylase [Conyzicola nivalis]
MFDRSFFSRSAVEVAPELLGARLVSGEVALRITEVEAYLGEGVDPGSHSFRGKTNRNAVMFGEPGHLYTYFTYGMHVCANVVCSPAGTSGGILLRAGEIVAGREIATARRRTSRSSVDLARGPARLTVALGITLADGGTDLASGPLRLELASESSDYESGPRTGVSGPGGGGEYPWRFWIPGDPTVSPYKAHAPKKRV